MADKIPTLTVPIASRENLEAKALRILLERRLTILLVKKDRIIAECRGTEKLHHLGYSKGDWFCHCYSGTHRNRHCSHLRALQMVTVRPGDD